MSSRDVSEPTLIPTIAEPFGTRPFCNRVQSTGEILAVPARGIFMGNRGRIHSTDGSLVEQLWERLAWITCVLSPARSPRTIMGDGYTHLFFLDEAVALAAGHRPCAQCRREAYDRFQDAWANGSGLKPLASTMDARLHRERVDPGSGAQRRHIEHLDKLPDGTVIFVPGTSDPGLVLGEHLLPCRPEGYGKALDRPLGIKAVVLTPKCSVAVLKAGYRPQLHPTAILADVR